MAFTYEEFEQEETERLKTQTEQQAVQEDLGFWGTVSDIAMAPVRGVVGAAEGVYSLTDALMFDVLPDAEENFGLGGSETFAGSTIEAITQFTVGFATPGVGGLAIASKLGKVSKFAKISKGMKASAEVRKAAGKPISSLLMARTPELAKYATAGAIADFTVFDGHEQRLSNLIQEMPSLQNPVTEFLAADDEDPELLGRLKAALEGAGLGLGVDAVLVGIRALRGARGAKTPEAAGDAVQETYKRLEAEEAAAKKATTEETPENLKKPEKEKVQETPEALEARLDNGEVSAKELDDYLNSAEGKARYPERASAAQRASDATQAQTREEIYEDAASDDFLRQAAGLNIEDMAQAGLDAQIKARRYAMFFKDRVQARAQKFVDFINEKLEDPTSLTDRDLADYVLKKIDYESNVYNMRAIYSETGRTLRSAGRDFVDPGGRRKPVPEQAINNPEDVLRLLEENGGRDFIRKDMERVQVAAGSGGLDGLGPAMQVVRGKATFMQATNEWWINSLLSGPQTIAVNALSAFATTILAPLERSLGAAASGRMREAGVEFARLAQLPREIGAALELGKIAFKSNRGVLEDVGSRGADAATGSESMITRFAQENKTVQKTASATGAKWLVDNINKNRLPGERQFRPSVIAGAIVTAPSRVLLGTDEVFKQLNFRTAARTRLTRNAIKEGVPSNQIDQYVEEQIQRLIGDGKRIDTEKFAREAKEKFKDAPIEEQFDLIDKYVNDQMDEYGSLGREALLAARQATFTEPLIKGRGPVVGVARTLQQGLAEHPALRLLFPFVRTPTNIVQYVIDRIPLIGQIKEIGDGAPKRILRRYQGDLDALQAGDEEAMGRFMAGSLFFGGGMIAAMNGTITGSGPEDYKQLQLKKQTGWQPYSIKVGDEYISYQRLDPFASVFGLMADLNDIMVRGDEEARDSAESLSFALLASISKNLTNKTYLQGLRDITGALFEPERNIGRVVSNMTASFVVPNLFAQIKREGQEELRDIKNMSDAIYNRIPGMGADIPLKRNVLGETIDSNNSYADLINPFDYTTVKDDTIMEEFDKIGHGFSPPRSMKNGVELRNYKNADGDTAYERWLELSSTTLVGGRTLRAALKRLMSSKRYRNLPYEAVEDVDRSPRVSLIQSLMNKYRAKAFEEMLREFPEVRKRDSINFLIRKRRKAGRDYRDLLPLIED